MDVPAKKSQLCRIRDERTHHSSGDTTVPVMAPVKVKRVVIWLNNGLIGRHKGSRDLSHDGDYKVARFWQIAFCSTNRLWNDVDSGAGANALGGNLMQ